MMTVVQIWFGIGAFVALMQVLQWMGDGCLCHAKGEQGVDRWYYVRGVIFNSIMHVIFGPTVLVVQLWHRLPVFPTSNPIAGVRRALRNGVTL